MNSDDDVIANEGKRNAMIPDDFRCYLVTRVGKEAPTTGVERRPFRELPDGDVVVRVDCSSLNYKDALAATGRPGVVKSFPHVPGIDAAGTVVESRSAEVAEGTEVIVTSHDLGAGRWGGWAEFVRVPAEWVVPLPGGLSRHEAMQLGTAGLTAALSVDALLQHGARPDGGEVLVTGSTGGVGSLAVTLLAKLGFSVTAVTGKPDRHDWLRERGAAHVVGREVLEDDSSRPLLSARWAAAVDTVGGAPLATLLKSVDNLGCVACCGLVAGVDVPTTMYPFILRGVTLTGVDSAWCPREKRLEIWHRLAGEWKPSGLDAITETIGLGALDEAVRRMLAGDAVGRTVVDVQR